MARLTDQYKSLTHELVRRMLRLEKWQRDVTGDSPLFDIANEHTPATLTTDQNNYDPGYYDVLRVNATADVSITGITRGKKGRFLEFYNISSYKITFPDDDSGSDAANRIAAPYDQSVTLLPNARVRFYYDSTIQRWTVSDAPNISGLYGKSALINNSSVAISIPDGVITTLSLTNLGISFDDWGYWDAGSNRFVIPASESGLYLIEISGYFDTHAVGGTQRAVGIFRDNLSLARYTTIPNIANKNTHITLAAMFRGVGSLGHDFGFAVLQESGGALNFTPLDLAICKLQ